MGTKTTERIQIEYRLSSHKNIKWVKVDDVKKMILACNKKSWDYQGFYDNIMYELSQSKALSTNLVTPCAIAAPPTKYKADIKPPLVAPMRLRVLLRFTCFFLLAILFFFY